MGMTWKTWCAAYSHCTWKWRRQEYGESYNCHLAGTVFSISCKGSCEETIQSTPVVNIFLALCNKMKKVPWIYIIRVDYICNVIDNAFPLAAATLSGPWHDSRAYWEYGWNYGCFYMISGWDQWNGEWKCGWAIKRQEPLKMPKLTEKVNGENNKSGPGNIKIGPTKIRKIWHVFIFFLAKSAEIK